MTPDAWFDRLRAALPASDRLALTGGEREALLDLARIAAHASERWTAPLSTFLVGTALGDQPSDRREASLRALVTELEEVE